MSPDLLINNVNLKVSLLIKRKEVVNAFKLTNRSMRLFHLILPEIKQQTIWSYTHVQDIRMD